MRVHKTKDWRLQAVVKWVPNRVPEQITCPSCLGSGCTGGAFNSLDAVETCRICWGKKEITKPGDELCDPPPPPSEELMAMLRAKWKEYFK